MNNAPARVARSHTLRMREKPRPIVWGGSGLPSPRPRGLVAAVDAARQAGLAGMAEIAALRAPGDLAVVAHAAEPPLRDVGHQDVVRAGAHLEAELAVAHAALEPDAVEPVRKHDGANAAGVGALVDHHVAVLGAHRSGRGERRGERRADERVAPDHFAVLGVLWQRMHSVSGNDTAPWHTPHCSPCRIWNIDRRFAPTCDLN